MIAALLERKREAYRGTFTAPVYGTFTRWQMLKFAVRCLWSPSPAYRLMFTGELGSVHPLGRLVLKDLRGFCGVDKGGIVVSPVQRVTDPYATVYRAATRDVYLRISKMLGVDVTVEINEEPADGRSAAESTAES